LYSWSRTYYSQLIHVYSWSRWTINLNPSTTRGWVEINCSAWSAVHVDELRLIVQRDQPADHAEQLISTHQRVQLITLNNYSQPITCTADHAHITLNSSTCTADHDEQLISLFSVISCTRPWVEINCSAWSVVHVDGLRLIVQRDQLWSRWTINLNSSTCTADHAEQLISTHPRVQRCTRGWVEINCSAWSAVHMDGLRLIVQLNQLYTWMSWD
jgi:hypothetical protein